VITRNRIIGAVVIVIVLLLPLVANAYQVDVLTQAASYSLFAVGLNVVVGLAGLLDLGYVAFWAIGAYSMAILSGAGPIHVFNLTPWVVLPIGILIAMLAGVLLGSPVLRLRGDYLAIVTLGFGEIIRITASNLDGVTGGAEGIANIPHPQIGAFNFGSSPTPYFYLTLALLGVAVFLISNLNRSRIGRAWVAIREDEVAAEAMGINTFRMKLWAFAFGASTAGAAGVINASRVNFVSPSSFLIITSVLVLCMVILGGMGSIVGPIVGAAAIVIIPEALRNYVPAGVRFMLFGAVLVVMMIFRPQGLIPSRRIAAEQHGVGVADEEKAGA
jgi:branched-chain amino acid transport system permease protein